MKQTKKDFQGIIKAIRTELGEKEYPKPMMTAAQMEKGEATVNCGGEWATTEESLARAKAVMENEGFAGFLEKYNASARMEMNNFKTYQIRIKF